MKTYYKEIEMPRERDRRQFTFPRIRERIKGFRLSPLMIIFLNVSVFLLLLSILDARKTSQITVTGEDVMQLIREWNATNEPMHYTIFLLVILFMWKSMMYAHNKKPQGALR